jgi:hypothetical protein
MIPFENVPSWYWKNLKFAEHCVNVRQSLFPNLWGLWQSNINSTLVFASDQCVVLQIQSLNAVVYVAAIYANNSYLARRHLWADLTRLHSQFIGPWLFLGDFNAVLGAHEKRGKRLPPKNSCDDFLLWTSANQLSHLNTIGVHFTWAKDRELNLWHFV